MVRGLQNRRTRFFEVRRLPSPPCDAARGGLPREVIAGVWTSTGPISPIHRPVARLVALRRQWQKNSGGANGPVVRKPRREATSPTCSHQHHRAAPCVTAGEEGRLDTSGGKWLNDSGIARLRTSGPVVAFLGAATTHPSPPVLQEDKEDRPVGVGRTHPRPLRQTQLRRSSAPLVGLLHQGRRSRGLGR